VVTDREAAETEYDGWCPVCYSPPDEFCRTPTGALRRDHKGRRPLDDEPS
jgi:hypothetical protein